MDHPRSRGVYPEYVKILNDAKGSSPLARGLPLDEARKTAIIGIIPARAGFTSTSSSSTSLVWDHPRSRGVYRPLYRPPAHAEGSSPLARGLRLMATVKRSGVRIIPARAGFTDRDPDGAEGAGDHPRSRGVYEPVSPIDDLRQGSSPLARGLPAAPVSLLGVPRIIPARAGFTLASGR